MVLSQKTSTQSIDALLKASQNFEEQLARDGVVKAHDWVFAIREMLYDLRRINLQLVDLYSTTDVNCALSSLQGFVQTVLYEVLPHVQGHMSELEEELRDVLPEADVPENDNSE